MGKPRTTSVGRAPAGVRLAGLAVALVAAGAWLTPGRAAAFNFQDSWPSGNATAPPIIYPNWKGLYLGSYQVWMYQAADVADTSGTGTERVVGLTVVNFGTAGTADITNLKVQISCSSANSGQLALTYAGTYTEDSGTYNAWTWTGSSPDLSGCADLCGAPPCGGYFNIDVYGDVTPCPNNFATVNLGFPTHEVTNTTYWGSISDNQNPTYKVPWYDMAGDISTIVYVYKTTDTDTVIPGDTVTYTLYYGKPGTSPLSNIVIYDSLPPYTHYLDGTGSPAPDLGYDPIVGPPLALRWTINPVPGNLPAWGPSSQISFSVSADWGNMESFEPGSGDVAAPEGQRLNNIAQVFFNGVAGAGCPTSALNPPVSTVVKRFMFWCLGDNDVLFSQTYGQPADEMIYSIFIRNLSLTKTWWNVMLWDTVPTQLDVWGPNLGMYDPCNGWTMTPSGCSAASAGRQVSAGKTILTWKLDMPPGMTLTLQYKGAVTPVAQPKTNVINTVSVLEGGRSGVVAGTGNSGVIKNFTHLAPIILPTMYTSYVGYAGGAGCCPGYFIDFFPLNKKTQFELRNLQYNGLAGFSGVGGVSASIGTFIGDCFNGFPAGGNSGCRAERIPAKFDPGMGAINDCIGFCPVLPFNYVFKLTSNSPVLWQVLTHIIAHDEDNHTYAPSTTLTYTGLMHYMWKRWSGPEWATGWGECLSLINTSLDPYGTYQATLDTTVYIFKWDYPTNTWIYWRGYDIAPESQAYDMTTALADEGPYRTVSSQSQLIVEQENLCNPSLNQGGHSDNEGAMMPIRETGNLTSLPGQKANFYGIHQGASQANKVVIGNLGAVDAVYRIWRYQPDNLVSTAPMPSWLNGTSGTWVLKATHSVPAGMGTANNPRVYPASGAFFDQSNTMVLSKIELISGGPIQVFHGIRVFSTWGGGAVLHPSDGTQAGIQYWLHHQPDETTGPPTYDTYVIDVFCPKQGMAVNLTNNLGLTTTYTTNGPDQAIAFVGPDAAANYVVSVLPNPSQGSVLCQFIANAPSEKGYTAPFLQQGVHYNLVAPPIVFAGTAFWITIVVQDTNGVTKNDYCGTTSFTSTDPTAKIVGTAMDLYNFTWASSIACSTGSNQDGVKIFLNVTLNVLGLQTVVAQDTTDGTINGLIAIMVVGADVKLTKTPRLQIAASGDTVQFKVCWSNYSSASAFSFTVTDAIPQGMTYLPEVASAMSCGDTDGVAPGTAVAYSTVQSASMPPAANFTAAGGGAPPGNTQWLRWTVPIAGVQTTGCVCYRVTVN